jgi:hypothetical protein
LLNSSNFTSLSSFFFYIESVLSGHRRTHRPMCRLRHGLLLRERRTATPTSRNTTTTTARDARRVRAENQHHQHQLGQEVGTTSAGCLYQAFPRVKQHKSDVKNGYPAQMNLSSHCKFMSVHVISSKLN